MIVSRVGVGEHCHQYIAEVAYYRMLFLEGTRAELGPVEAALTAFTASVRTAMRSAGVEAFTYTSARDAAGGVNVGVFSPYAFLPR